MATSGITASASPAIFKLPTELLGIICDNWEVRLTDIDALACTCKELRGKVRPHYLRIHYETREHPALWCLINNGAPLEVFKSLVDHGACPNDWGTSDSMAKACKSHRVDVVELLIHRGFDWWYMDRKTAWRSQFEMRLGARCIGEALLTWNPNTYTEMTKLIPFLLDASKTFEADRRCLPYRKNPDDNPAWSEDNLDWLEDHPGWPEDNSVRNSPFANCQMAIEPRLKGMWLICTILPRVPDELIPVLWNNIGANHGTDQTGLPACFKSPLPGANSSHPAWLAVQKEYLIDCFPEIISWVGNALYDRNYRTEEGYTYGFRIFDALMNDLNYADSETRMELLPVAQQLVRAVDWKYRRGEVWYPQELEGVFRIASIFPTWDYSIDGEKCGAEEDQILDIMLYCIVKGIGPECWHERRIGQRVLDEWGWESEFLSTMSEWEGGNMEQCPLLDHLALAGAYKRFTLLVHIPAVPLRGFLRETYDRQVLILAHALNPALNESDDNYEHNSLLRRNREAILSLAIEHWDLRWVYRTGQPWQITPLNIAAQQLNLDLIRKLIPRVSYRAYEMPGWDFDMYWDAYTDRNIRMPVDDALETRRECDLLEGVSCLFAQYGDEQVHVYFPAMEAVRLLTDGKIWSSMRLRGYKDDPAYWYPSHC